ncbi:MAG: VRR-NUC domain-containing protein [Lachnospiraceae bacterium]|nr:VRR-NUC domain-containing protein [Lachnospiraceae bacterium]
MRERDLERKFRDAVRESGGRAYKFVSPGNDGVPDRLVVLPGGRIGFVELKQKGKKPSGLQEQQIKVLQSLGCFVTVLDSPEDIQETIRRIREAGGGPS